VPEFSLVETTIAEAHAAMAAGQTSAAALVDRYRARIAAYDDALHAVLTLNDGAPARARKLDDRFASDGPVGPLHGIPLLVKDNHDTGDMPTTAGATALADAQPTHDAAVVARLRDAGAVVLGKTNLQELSFGADTVSSLGGATRNAYDRDRRPSGSSGGTAVAVAANLALAGTGTDTCSSVRSPPAFAACVGVRPTRGLVSRRGLVPLSETQDTAGPIARTVADAARLLEAMAGYDPADPVTARGVGRIPAEGYAAGLDDVDAAAVLDDARFGVVRTAFGLNDPESASPDDAAAVTSVVEDALADLAAADATLVDPVAVADPERVDDARVVVHEFARDIDRYLAEHAAPPHDSLAALYETGTIAPVVAERIDAAGALDVDTDGLDTDPDYLGRLRRRAALRDTVLARMADADLDALVYPPSTIPPVEIPAHQPFAELNCGLAAHTGLPSLVVPAGFTDDGLPVGVEFLGRAFAEARLFELGAAVERVVDGRRPPDGFGPLDAG
jgi:Asp-tRNA(Asn)/Glu-tRNA(Gln) amidotransferase A subunit family amidase